MAELHTPEALDDVLPRADFVILTIPHTPETEGLMNAARFGRMKPSAFFINIGRGKTTRLDDLVAALAVAARSPAPAWMSSKRSRCRRTTRCGTRRTCC